MGIAPEEIPKGMPRLTLGQVFGALIYYSPDFMPVEHFWQWLREAVTIMPAVPSKLRCCNEWNNFNRRLMPNPLPSLTADG